MYTTDPGGFLPRPSLALIAASTLVLAAVHIGVQAQSAPASSAPPAATLSLPATSDPAPRTVHVDAIVTDKQGNPIVNLRPADFEIYENGVSQKIESAELTSKTTPSSASDRIESPAPVNDVTGLDIEERAAREPGTRVIALYLDEFHVSAGVSTERVRTAVSRFLDEQLRPRDLVLVMKPLDHVTDIRITRDHDLARRAVTSFNGRKDDYTPRTTFEEEYLGRSPSAVRVARAQIVMSGLRALATRMGELNGGLAGIVLISEGFTTDVPRSREGRLPDLQGLVRAASRFRVLLYAFDPGTPQPFTVSPDATDPTVSTASSAALQSLARQTGGEPLLAGQDLVPALQHVSRDLDTYYVLTYRSTTANDGRFYNLQVRSSRRDAQVRTRSGYWAPLPSELRSTRISAPSIAPMRALRRSLQIDSWLGTTVEADGRRRVIFTWTPATGSRRAKPTARPEIVSLKVSTTTGMVLFEGEVAPAGRGGTVSRQRSDSAVFQATPGRLQFDLTILRADGTKLDEAAQDFDVPEVRRGAPIILQPQLFRTASAREFREISADSNAAPLPAREFRRTERLLVRVPTYDASGSRVQVSAKLINRVGAVLLELVPMSDNDGRSLAQFDLPLARFAPGEYSIEVAAQSDSGLARELIRFRITG